MLARGRWPGNARQLGNVLERALVLRDEHVPVRAPLTTDEIVDSMDGVDLSALPLTPTPPASRSVANGGPTPPALEAQALPEKVAALEHAEILFGLAGVARREGAGGAGAGHQSAHPRQKIADLGIDVWAAGAASPVAGERP